MEGWVESLFFVISHSAMRTLHSAIEEGGSDVMDHGRLRAGGPFRVQSLKFNVESKSNSLVFREGRHGQDR